MQEVTGTSLPKSRICKELIGFDSKNVEKVRLTVGAVGEARFSVEVPAPLGPL